VYILAKEEVVTVFSSAQKVLMDCNNMDTKVINFLCHENMQNMSNLRVFQASLVPDLLKHILPSSCFMGRNVALTNRSFPSTSTATAQIEFDILLKFVSNFWIFASSRADVISAIAEGASVVPYIEEPSAASALSIAEITEITLNLSPLSRTSALMGAHRGDLSIPEDIKGILQAIGVKILNPLVLSNHNVAIVQSFWEYVYSPSRSGMLAVIDAAIRTYKINAQGKAGSLLSVDTVKTPIDTLNAVQRERLRMYIVSCESVNTLSESDCAIIRQLPIFSTFKDPNTYLSIGSLTPPPSSKSIQSNISSESNLWESCKNKQFFTIENCNISRAILPPNLLRYSNSSDMQFFKKLGIQKMKRSKFYDQEVLSRVDLLYKFHAEEIQGTLVMMLEELKVLCLEDTNFISTLKSTAFISTSFSPSFESSMVNSTISNSTDKNNDIKKNISLATVSLSDETSSLDIDLTNAKANVTLLRKPCDLFDPQVIELLDLLDPSCFPSQAFRRPDLLLSLKSLGLADNLNFTSVLACARSIAQSGIESQERGKEGSLEMEKATGRGLYLLNFLNKNMSRLIEDDKKNVMQKNSFYSSIRSLSLFGEKGENKETPMMTADQWLQVFIFYLFLFFACIFLVSLYKE
jgi:hypothetical protein